MTERATPFANRPKRSGRVGLSRMAGAVSGVALLAGCGSNEPAPVQAPEEKGPKIEVAAFENQFECQANSGLGEEGCAEARKQAVATAAETAPRFAAAYDCEAEWGQGNCMEQTQGGQSFFMPFVTGFLLGKVLTGNKRDIVPLFRKTKDGPLQTANGVRLGYGGAPGKYVAAARALERPTAIPKIRSASPASSQAGMTQQQESSGRRGFAVVRTGG
ncbi:MAG TPA: DUF1190 domain-containing protein [Novosphingobium sp.]|nr:DUF1190 domain-containing protein [Novosphingobium sp.]